MTILTARGIRASYRQQVVLDGIDVNAESGEVLGIIGANGAGKSTLLRLLAGLTAPQEGEVRLDGERFDSHSSKRLAYLEQRSSCHWPMACQELVALGRLPHQSYGRRLSAEDKRAIKQAMTEADVLHLRHRPATELSTGEQARVFLARALAVEPQILLVDEPVAGLDPAHQLGVMELLKQKAATGMAVVAVLHDLALAARFCHRLLLLHEGSVLVQGSPAEVLTAEHLQTALQVEAHQGQHKGEPFIIPWRGL